jgi:hypothetical protein
MELAIWALIEHLRQIHGAPIDEKYTERHRYMVALQAITLFLEGLGECDLADWFALFRLQLNDLDSGVVSPALAPNPDVAHRPNPSLIAMLQATVAVGVAKLAEGGLSRSDIEKKLDGAEYADLRQLTQAGKGLGKSALSWRAEYGKGRKKDQFACRIWDQIQASCAVAGQPPLEAAESCLRTAAEQLKQAQRFLGIGVTESPPAPPKTAINKKKSRTSRRPRR